MFSDHDAHTGKLHKELSACHLKIEQLKAGTETEIQRSAALEKELASAKRFHIELQQQCQGMQEQIHVLNQQLSAVSASGEEASRQLVASLNDKANELERKDAQLAAVKAELASATEMHQARETELTNMVVKLEAAMAQVEERRAVLELELNHQRGSATEATLIMEERMRVLQEQLGQVRAVHAAELEERSLNEAQRFSMISEEHERQLSELADKHKRDFQVAEVQHNQAIEELQRQLQVSTISV